MKVLTSHELKKSKTKPMKHLKGYVGIHSSGFRDFLLKPELLRSIVDSGFKHPSEGCRFWGKWSCSMFLLQRLHKSFHEVH
ncbi:hypothetical protein E1A91_A04G078000v1 [Gossypium mustelinum]|uniref:DEAD-box RNA helicase Q domain-containing protein n=1 Tax=Gossypium mustelinum TaxID=34275 RepID=A0A5D2ZN28_GOSMU|nr:hypothetical protein E1A91_A04G078000v1 [Gossypium mustelinum]